jgi:hypothetical protein
MMDGLIGCRGSRWRGGGIVKRVRTKKLLLHDCGDDYHGWSSFSRIWNMFLMNLVQTSSSRVVWSITEDGHVQRCLGRLTVEALVTALFFENPCGCSSRCCWHTVIDLFSWNGHAQLHGLSPPLSSLSASFLPLFPSLPQHLELFCIILPTSTQHCIVASSHIASFPVQAILYDYSWYFGVSQHSFTYPLFHNFIPTSIVLRSHFDVSSTFVPCCLNFHSHPCSCSTHPHSSNHSHPFNELARQCTSLGACSSHHHISSFWSLPMMDDAADDWINYYLICIMSLFMSCSSLCVAIAISLRSMFMVC